MTPTVDEVVISHETTQDISVWAPTQDGSWPVILMAHGVDGFRDELALTAKALASEGHVVFVPDIRTDPTTLEYDSACSYRYAMSVADEHHGDLDQPVTLVGHSLGASTVLVGGLNEAQYGPGGTFGDCETGALPPDVIVSIAGCHYEYAGTTFAFEPIPSSWTNHDAQLTLVAGQNDETCEPWQSQDTTEVLRAAGYDVSYVEIEGATHSSIISNEIVDGEWLLAPDAPGATATVEAILDAIERAQSSGDDGSEPTPTQEATAASGMTTAPETALSAADSAFDLETSTLPDWLSDETITEIVRDVYESQGAQPVPGPYEWEGGVWMSSSADYRDEGWMWTWQGDGGPRSNEDVAGVDSLVTLGRILQSTPDVPDEAFVPNAQLGDGVLAAFEVFDPPETSVTTWRDAA